MADRFTASIDGWELDVETIDDGWDKAITEHEAPWKDGARTEDMGRKARVIRLRCYWLADRYAEHYDFLDHLAGMDLCELVHPKYGIVNGRVKSISVRHDDRVETAEADISFVQDGGGTVAQASPDMASEADEDFIAGQQEHIDRMRSTIGDAIGDDAATVFGIDLDPALGILEQISGVTLETREYLKRVETFVGTVQAAAIDAANPATSVISLIDYGLDLPGRIVGSIARSVERYAESIDSLRSAPGRFSERLSASIDDLANACGEFGDEVRIGGAHRMGLETSTQLADDAENRRTLIEIEKQPAFDALGNFSAPDPAPVVMTVNDLEQTLATTRASIQAAIDVDRSMQSLKNMAGRLVRHVADIKSDRERMKTVQMDNATPLHLVCLMHGLKYTAAPRMLAVNDIPHPNFTTGEVRVYGR